MRVGLDVDDTLYDCNAYALSIINARHPDEEPVDINEIRGWGNYGRHADERIALYYDPEFVKSQPILPGAKKFVRELSKLADETYKAFEKLREDLSGNFEMARRYSAEARNNRDILNDYIALLQINDIVKSGDKDANKKIAKIAGERRKNRLDLIREMEDFKEEYLHASHLRNQSIFMQIFADIEAYAKNTPAEEFTLDVCDLRGIASDMMNTMR